MSFGLMTFGEVFQDGRKRCGGYRLSSPCLRRKTCGFLCSICHSGRTYFAILLCTGILMVQKAFAASDQAALDSGGSGAQQVVQSAYLYLASTWIFELPYNVVGKNSASCWALTVLVRYDKEQASKRLAEAFDTSDNVYLKIYALIGLHLITPDESRWEPLRQSNDFLNRRIFVYSPFITPSPPITVRELFERLKTQGGYSTLLLKHPLPDRDSVAHPVRPIMKIGNEQI